MGNSPFVPDPSSFIPITPEPSPAEQQASTLQRAVSYGATQNPDQYAKLLTLHKQTGVPPVASQGNEAEVQQAADVNSLDYNTMAVDHPRTTAWASKPDNAAVSGVPEVQRIAGVEKNAGVMRAVSSFDWYTGKAQRSLTEYPLTRWAMDAVGGTAGMAGNVASFLGLHGDGPTEQNFLQRIESGLDPEAVGSKSDTLDWVAKNIAPMIPAMLASGGTSLIAKTLGLSSTAAKVLTGLSIGGMFTADQGGKTYTAMKEAGASDYEARLAANRVATINAPANALFGATDLIPFLRNNPVGTSLFLGGATGGSGQASQNVVTGKPWYQGIIGASLQGAAMQGGMHIGTEMFFDHLGQVIDAADQSKLKQRSPEAFHDAMSKVFEGDPSLKIPVDQFMEYFHSKGVAAQSVAEQLGVKNYAEALVSGGDVEIPTADFLSKLDAEHQQGLFADIVGPTGLTLRQHEQGRQEIESWMATGGPEKLQADAAQADAETAATPEYLATKEELRSRYIGAGETPEVADTLATKDANVYANLAKSVGIKPTELMKLYDPQVKAEEESAGVLYQDKLTVGGLDGRDSALLTPNGKLPAKYRLVEADDLIASHNAVTFAVNPKYPNGVQERAYDKSPEAQNRVIEQAQNYEPAYTVNTNPDAVNGPPVITPSGVVLGGNSRTMATQRLYNSGAGEIYKSALRDNAADYGFKPEDVDAMKHPVLVRQVGEPSSIDAMRRLGTDLNRSMTGALGAAEKAVSAGKNIKPATVQWVAGELQASDTTLREMLSSRGAEVIKRLVEDGAISERERPQYVDAQTGGLNESGKAFVEKALLGTVVDDPRLMESAPKSIIAKIERALGSITSFASRADEWNILPALRAAIAEHAAIQRSGSSVDLRLGQSDMFGGDRNPLVDALVRTLDAKPTEVRDAFESFARDSDANLPGQSRMFGSAEPFDAFNNAFGSKLSGEEFVNGLEKATESEPVREGAPNDESVSRPSSGEQSTGGESSQIQQELDSAPLHPDAALSASKSRPRGWFRVLPDGSFEIGRTKIGDLSTFVHEPAHGYLQMIGDLAKREDASEVLKGDYSKILEFLGAKDGETLSTEQQEKWARANEQYLREGKAPSAGLKGVFQRFAVWLSSIYKKASDLGVELTPDIRGVFDRLYASEEGVNRAEAESGPRLFQRADEAGWTEDQFQKYADAKGLEVEQAKSEILSKLNEAALREKTDTWREEEKNVREAMTAEIDRKPEYVAIRTLRKGKMEDGTELTLNREELVKQFGEDRVKALQKAHPGLYRNEGGIDTETAAEMLGFDSAGKMMSVLEATPRRSAAVSEATKAYMTAKHGDIRYDGTLDDQARLAVENEKRAQNLHSELTALRRKVAELKQSAADKKAALRSIETAPIDAYREAARQMVESKAIADLLPNRYLDASRKYSREAFDALRKGDVEEAAAAKHKELMNHFLFREATKARDKADVITTYAKKLGQMKELRKLGLAGRPYLEQIQALLGRYGFDVGANRSLLEANGPRQETLAQFLTRLKDDENLDLPIDPKLLDESRPNQSYRSIPFSELSNVYDAMKAIDHAAKIVNSVRAEGKRVAIAQAAANLNLRLEDSIGNPEVRKSSDRARSFLERVKDVNLDIAVIAPEFMFERFDGLSKQGPWHDYFWSRYNDAADHLNRLREMVFPKIMEYRGTEIDRSKKFYIQSIDRTLTKDDIISIALNSGNESNLDKQMRGGIQFEKDESPTQLNETSLHEILSNLTPDEIKMVNGIWRTIETLKPEAAALERKRTGIEPKWIEPKPLDIANGKLEGGYYPLKYDPRFSAAGEKQSDASTVTQMFTKYASSSTKQGYLKGRTKFAAPLTLDWQATVSRHLDEVATDISHWEFASDAQRLLKNADVKGSIMRNLGNAYYKNLLDWVRYTVNQDSMGREASDNIDKFRRTMRTNVATAVLGFRVMNAVVETGITPLLAIQHVPAQSVFKGTMTYLRNPIEATKFARDSSDYVKRIDNAVDRDISIALNDLAGKTTLLDDVRRWSIESRMWFWKIGAMMAWHSGYHDAVNNQRLEGQDAVRVADSIYRMTQEAGRPGDLSAVQRNPYMKELTQFIGPALIQYNNYRRSASAFIDQGVNQKTVALGITTLLAGGFVNNVLFNVLRGKGPGDKEGWPAWLAARMTFGMADGFPIARDVAGYAEGKLLGEKGRDFRLSPALQVGKDTVDASLATAHAFEGKTTPGKAMKQSARAVGALTGFPATQANITAEYIYDVMSGNYKPAHPWSPITDAFYARSQH